MIDFAEPPLLGRTALVTGAGRNTGRAIALALARAGAAVAVNVRTNQAEADTVVDEIIGFGGSAMSVVADVSSESDVGRMVDTAGATLGPITILVCSAAARSLTPFTELTSDEWERVVRTSLFGGYYCTRAVVGGMQAAGYGRLVYLTADGAHTGLPDHAHVAAAKLGVEGMMKVLARELGPFGVTANAISPGGLDTDRRGSHSPERLAALDEALAATVARSPIRRLVAVAEIAELCTFLCLPASGYLTGQTIHANGGTFSGG